MDRMKYLFLILLPLLYIGCSSSVSTIDDVNAGESNITDENSKKAMESFLNGIQAESKGDYARAILEYQDALKLDPKPGIYYQLAKNYFFINKLPLALQNAKKSVELDSANIEYLNLLQEIYTAAKQNASAIETLEKIINIDSSQINAYYKLARLHENQRPLKAIEVYEKLLKIIGNEWSVLVRVAELYERLGMIDKSISSIEELLALDPGNTALQKLLIDFYVRNKQFDKAVENIEDIIRFYPDDLDARERKAQIFIELGEWDKASHEYDFIMQQPEVEFDIKVRIGAAYFTASFKDTTLLPVAKKFFERIDKDSSDWQVKMYLGVIAIREHNDSVGVEYFNSVTEMAPWNPEGWIRLGGILFDNRQYEEATEVLSRGVEKFPEDFTINLILGISYAQIDKHKEAKQYLKKAVSVNPNDVTALSSYGYTLSRLNEGTEAISYLKKALAISPGSIELLGTLGLVYDGLEMWDECDSTYSAALDIDSSAAIIKNNWAYSLSKRNERLDKALQMAKEAVEAEPLNSSYLDTIGWVYFKLGIYKEAEEFIKNSLEVGGEKAVILDHLGDVYFMSGRKDEAIETWKKAAELDPSDESIKLKIEKGEL